MKRKATLMAILLMGMMAKAQKVYLSQDFNSSTDYLTYVGTDKNQFDGLVFNGNAKINTSKNTLRIIKNGGKGLNRAGIVKTTDFGFATFLKFEMDITVSENKANVPKGFRISITDRMEGVFPAAPVKANIHSDLYINPTETPGTFILQAVGAPHLSSKPLSGTQKLVWYINNASKDATYKAPDGSFRTVKEDFSDVWTIDESGKAELVLAEIPAVTPSLVWLRRFKISNDENFTATLDIDNMVLSEEPMVKAKKKIKTDLPD